MIIIFDLDYTLLDTSNHRKAMAKQMGIDLDKYLEIYKKHYSEKNINFSFYSLINILIKEGYIKNEEKEKYRKKIRKFLKKEDKYLFPGVKKVIRKLKKDNKLFLVTYGDKVWQKQKVDNLSIKNSFKKIIYTDIEKSKIFTRYRNAKEIIVINDNAKESMKIQEEVKKAKIYLVDGPYTNNCEHNFEIIKIKDIVSYVDRIKKNK